MFAKEKSSFRDPSGYLFRYDNVLYRCINKEYRNNYELLMQSGLYSCLVAKGMLVEHEADIGITTNTDDEYLVIRPSELSFISYPYEWCFSQLKDAALLTLEIQKVALEHGMSLKDASAYNIQFAACHPIFIDTLSFEKYEQNRPWKAYRQFCQHFLSPLCLMAYTDIRLNQLLKLYIDGVPLDLASTLLPGKSMLNLGVMSHIHLHSKSQKSYEDKQVDLKKYNMSLTSFKALIESLYIFVSKLALPKVDTEWGDYYDNTNYSEESFDEKKRIIEIFLAGQENLTIWDLGANTGVFSRVSQPFANHIVASDIDPIAVEKNYLQCKKENNQKILPLIVDLTNPSPAIGWDNAERPSLKGRGIPPSVCMALALIHHLVISNNISLDMAAEFFAGLCKTLIIEFVPKEDSQVKRLLSTRKDIFTDYTKEGFEKAFSRCFTIQSCEKIGESFRYLYKMASQQ